MPKERPIVYETPSGAFYTVTKHNTRSYKTNRIPKGAIIRPEDEKSQKARSRTSGTPPSSKKGRKRKTKKTTTTTTKSTTTKKTTATKKDTDANVIVVKETIGNRTYAAIGRDGEMLTFAQVLDALMSTRDNAIKGALHRASSSLRIPQDDSFNIHDGFVAQIGK